jgi:hypothetical protein
MGKGKQNLNFKRMKHGLTNKLLFSRFKSQNTHIGVIYLPSEFHDFWTSIMM